MSNPEQQDGTSGSERAFVAPAPSETASADQVSIRRAPKFGVFIVGGGLLGFVATVIVVLATMGIEHAPAADGTTSAEAGFWGLVGYFSLYGVSAGLVLGAIAAIVLDRWYGKRAHTLTAERIGVAMPTETGPAEGGAERRAAGLRERPAPGAAERPQGAEIESDGDHR